MLVYFLSFMYAKNMRMWHNKWHFMNNLFLRVCDVKIQCTINSFFKFSAAFKLWNMSFLIKYHINYYLYTFLIYCTKKKPTIGQTKLNNIFLTKYNNANANVTYSVLCEWFFYCFKKKLEQNNIVIFIYELVGHL